jgi:hypothetical protein
MAFIRDPASANETDDNASTDDEGKDETVSAIPRRCPAMSCRSSVGIVQGVESKELHDQRICRWKENCWPCNGWSNDTDGISSKAVVSAVCSPFKSPMNGTEAGQDLSKFS